MESLSQKKNRIKQKKKNLEESKLKKLLADIKQQSPEQRKKELGTDPAKGYIEHEAEVGTAIEKQFGYFKRSPKADEEWISLSGQYKGKKFDLIGHYRITSLKIPDNIFKEKFIGSLKRHITKNDIVILDYRYFTENQRRIVQEFMESISSPEKVKSIFSDNDLTNIR